MYTGGIGSYALLVMVAAFLMLHPSRQGGAPGESSLGVLLLDFFRLFGRVLNTQLVGISCRCCRSRSGGAVEGGEDAEAVRGGGAGGKERRPGRLRGPREAQRQGSGVAVLVVAVSPMHMGASSFKFSMCLVLWPEHEACPVVPPRRRLHLHARFSE